MWIDHFLVEVRREKRARDPQVVANCRRRQPTLVEEIALKITFERPVPVIHAARQRWLQDARLPQVLQETTQRFRIGAPQASLTSSIRKEPFQNLLAEVVGLQAPAVHPLTQTGDRPQLSPPRVDRIAMLGQVLRESIQIATQRTDTQSLADGIGAEIVVHGVFSSADRA